MYEDKISLAIERLGLDCSFCSLEEGNRLIELVAHTFGFDLDSRWLWDKAGGEGFDYDAAGWRPLLEQVLAELGDRVVLVVTDDEFYPWRVLDCAKGDVAALLGELPYFEYFVFDVSMRCVVFDTHHNRLVIFRLTHQMPKGKKIRQKK